MFEYVYNSPGLINRKCFDFVVSSEFYMREKDFLPLLGGVAWDSGGRVGFHLDSVLVRYILS